WPSSALAVAMYCPSELTATLLRIPGCSTSERISCPEAASHTFTSPRLGCPPALIMRWPSGLNTTPRTGPVCPLSVSSSCQVPASQSLTVSSKLALVRRLPSGLNVTLLTPAVCPLRQKIDLPVLASHTWTVRSGSSAPLASHLPSGLKARH